MVEARNCDGKFAQRTVWSPVRRLLGADDVRAYPADAEVTMEQRRPHSTDVTAYFTSSFGWFSVRPTRHFERDLKDCV